MPLIQIKPVILKHGPVWDFSQNFDKMQYLTVAEVAYMYLGLILEITQNLFLKEEEDA